MYEREIEIERDDLITSNTPNKCFNNLSLEPLEG